MRRSPRLGMILAALLGLAFAAGLARLLVLRFEAGDVYPPYSSLRADPLGARVLHDSLALLPQVRVVRNYQDLERVEAGGDATLFLLGLPPGVLDELDVEDWRLLRAFAARGARVVLTVSGSVAAPPATALARFLRSAPGPSTNPAPAACPVGPADAGSARGFQVERQEPGPDAFAQRMAPVPDLPAALPWPGAFAFTGLTGAWQTVYARAGKPVLLECRVGRGSLVVAADSYYLSNEALCLDRRPALLAWFAGPGRTLVFDETHLGLAETPGVAKLVRRYRLQGFVAGLLLLAGLFLWRQLAVFLPAVPDAGAGAAWIRGRDSLSGLASLLARRVPRRRLLRECVEAWNRAAALAGGPARPRLTPPPESDGPPPSAAQVLADYERFRQQVQERKHRP